MLLTSAPPSNITCTVVPTSAVPVKIGVETLVMLSVLDMPLSEAAIEIGCGRRRLRRDGVDRHRQRAGWRAGAPGGIRLSAVTVVAALAEHGTGDGPVAGAHPRSVVPSTVVPLVSKSFTVAPASAPLPVNTGVLTLVILSVLEIPLSDAAVRSGRGQRCGDNDRRCRRRGAGVAGRIGCGRAQRVSAAGQRDRQAPTAGRNLPFVAPTRTVPSNSCTTLPTSAVPLAVTSPLFAGADDGCVDRHSRRLGIEGEGDRTPKRCCRRYPSRWR